MSMCHVLSVAQTCSRQTHAELFFVPYACMLCYGRCQTGTPCGAISTSPSRTALAIPNVAPTDR